jgi:predicted acetyltransferase
MKMTVSLRDARDHAADMQWIEEVYRDYLDDLGLLNTGLFPALAAGDARAQDPLQRWLVDRSALVITILDDRKPAGFAMIARESHAGSACDFRMAEFFIDRRHRRRGIGRSAVRLILDRFAGRWEIVEYTRNPAAVQFWRNVVTGYTGGRYRERSANGEVHQYFSSLQPRTG